MLVSNATAPRHKLGQGDLRGEQPRHSMKIGMITLSDDHQRRDCHLGEPREGRRLHRRLRVVMQELPAAVVRDHGSQPGRDPRDLPRSLEDRPTSRVRPASGHTARSIARAAGPGRPTHRVPLLRRARQSSGAISRRTARCARWTPGDVAPARASPRM